ncbi:MAG: STAS/SEC14 domain-containing protein [Thermoanaerobaculia bacterium]
MPETHSIGSHTTWFEEPDLIGLRLSGDVSVAESEVLAREHLEMAEGRGSVFMLVDMTEFGSGTPAGRKVTSEALHRMPVRGVAVCRAKLTSRVMAKLVFAGVKLFGKERRGFPIEFFDDEPQARAWIEEARGIR